MMATSSTTEKTVFFFNAGAALSHTEAAKGGGSEHGKAFRSKMGKAGSGLRLLVSSFKDLQQFTYQPSIRLMMLSPASCIYLLWSWGSNTRIMFLSSCHFSKSCWEQAVDNRVDSPPTSATTMLTLSTSTCSLQMF